MQKPLENRLAEWLDNLRNNYELTPESQKSIQEYLDNLPEEMRNDNDD